ncbi:hypothetical protein MSG28_006624 [Choristoneura fumiferana]|uniref:Uncharacterized protein n=1 Tax=Choristoneura fumiferana TaxID=7141 RepID=A0ACC0JFL7_CHOFU|nr:hypothetical protein MSG28_006624 [Choristoneura fumiferana]
MRDYADAVLNVSAAGAVSPAPCRANKRRTIGPPCNVSRAVGCRRSGTRAVVRRGLPATGGLARPAGARRMDLKQRVGGTRPRPSAA